MRAELKEHLKVTKFGGNSESFKHGRIRNLKFFNLCGFCSMKNLGLYQGRKKKRKMAVKKVRARSTSIFDHMK